MFFYLKMTQSEWRASAPVYIAHVMFDNILPIITTYNILQSTSVESHVSKQIHT
jgi:hypothetical protein